MSVAHSFDTLSALSLKLRHAEAGGLLPANPHSGSHTTLDRYGVFFRSSLQVPEGGFSVVDIACLEETQQVLSWSG